MVEGQTLRLPLPLKDGFGLFDDVRVEPGEN